VTDPFDQRDGMQAPPDNSDIYCETCGGSGEVIIGENRVTRDMAIDAGDLQYEGQFHSYAYGSCPDCEGTGENKK
jgi:hypothetical protein